MNEGELITACQAGDRSAFRMLFECYQDRVYSLAMNFCNDATQAQDITQEVFLKLFRTIGQFRQEASFTTWLHRIVVNACLNQQRSARRWVELEDAQPDLNATGGGQEQQLERRQIAEAIGRAVSELSPDLRASLLLRYTEGCSYAEIAEALNCSMGTVASRLNRAHKLLGQKLWNLRSLVK